MLTAFLCIFLNIFFQLKLSEKLNLRFSLLNTRQNSRKCLLCSYMKFQELFFPLAYLKNNNLAIISLQVECPGGGDEAVGLVHYILP